jgi:PadR family transcriptional regulator, regulatory protein PadR
MYLNTMSNNNLIKGSLQTIILKLLEENEKMYGYEITQRVKELTAGEIKITEGALYPALHKLEADGLLTTEIQQVDNRVRKYYSLTKTGQKEVSAKMSELQSFVGNLQRILDPDWKPGLV